MGIRQFMGKLGNASQAFIRHDYKKACYRAFLADFPIDEIKEYFASVPLAIGGKEIKGKDLYSLLWSDHAEIPMYYDYALDNALEPFLVAKGKNVREYMNRVLWLNNQSTYIPGKVLLTWFYPKLEHFFDSLDSRDMVFPLITLFTENYLPKHIHRRVKKWQDGEWSKSIQVFIGDKDFEEYLEWDYEFIAGPQILNGPVMFGMPPFEKFSMIADTRLPERIIWVEDHKPEFLGNEMLIGGKAVGRRKAFGQFCREREIDLSRFNPPELEGFEVLENYWCPLRKRIVLHRDCLYGAPVFLNQVEHRRIAVQSKGLLSNLITDITREAAAHKDALTGKHLELLASLAGSSHFVYHPEDESLTLNDAYFAKGIPAKIMRSLLIAYTEQGKRDFEYRFLKRDFEISLGQKNSNFEVRFYRLVEKLQSESRGVRIEKTGRGRFRISVDGEFSYREETHPAAETA